MIKCGSITKGGAGPAEGDTIILNNELVATVPVGSDFVKDSPFTIIENENRLVLEKSGEKICGISFQLQPLFYGYTDKSGIPLWKIALRHGRNCLATTVVQRCVYWNTRKQCGFCGIELSLKNGATIDIKSPEQLAEAALMASKLDGISHITLTTGTQSAAGRGTDHLYACVKKIKETIDIPVHVQIEPAGDISRINNLKDSGADTIGIHLESFDSNILKQTAPAKAAYGLERYTQFWEYAVKIFGHNQVSSFLIAGLGEDENSIIEGARYMANIGVYPYIIPLRPIPGSLMQYSKPPAPEAMIRIYEKAASIIKESGLSAAKSRAGCVRCGACSAVTDFEIV
jgi:radical SAM protein (TIGR04043 family)